MKRKIKEALSWLVFILPIGLLTGIAIYKLYEPKVIEEENVTEQTEVKPVEKTVEKKEEMSDVPEVLETPSHSDCIEETLSDDLPEESEEDEGMEIVENIPPQKNEWNSIYIPLIKSLFSASDVSMDAFQNHIAQSEPPVRGKIYYQGENGWIESFLTVDEKGAIHEVLFSYDLAGNPVDNVEIGLLVPDSSERKYATISVNKLSVFELTTSGVTGKKQERVTEYSITPQLRFKKGRTFSKLL